MRSAAALAGLAALAACGGSSPGGGGGGGGLAVNAFTGTIAVTSALPAGTTSCQGTSQVVTFLPAGTDLHNVDVAGGGCVRFHNGDAAPHRPAARAAGAACAGLDAPAEIAAGGDYVAGPLGAAAGPLTCDWQDLNNPPGTTGGGGGGGGGY